MFPKGSSNGVMCVCTSAVTTYHLVLGQELLRQPAERTCAGKGGMYREKDALLTQSCERNYRDTFLIPLVINGPLLIHMKPLPLISPSYVFLQLLNVTPVLRYIFPYGFVFTA